MNQAAAAYQQGHYGEAAGHIEAAPTEAEGFGEQDLRLAETLNSLGTLYRHQRHKLPSPGPDGAHLESNFLSVISQLALTSREDQLGYAFEG